MSSTTDVGTWVVGHSGQLVATFFFPLPEPSWLPSVTFPSYYKPGAAEISVTEQGPPDVRLRRVDRDAAQVLFSEFLPQAHDSADVDTEQARPLINWTNKWILNSSILLHHVPLDPVSDSRLDAAMSVARAASAGMMDPAAIVRNAEEHRRAWAYQRLTDEQLAPDVSRPIITVAECAVELRVIGEPTPGDEILLPIQPDPDPGPLESDFAYPDLVAIWQWRTGSPEALREVILRRTRMALDIALTDLQHLQQAEHAVTRQPITLVTKERLPSLIPYLLRQYGAIGNPSAAAETGFAVVNLALWDMANRQVVGEDGLAALSKARQQLREGAFATHLDLHREAQVALRRQGDTRGAAIYAALSAESILSELLLHLMWEERLTRGQRMSGRQTRAEDARAGLRVRQRAGPRDDW